MTVPDRFFSLTDRRALVTGGSRGLGREMAIALASAGADVTITGRDEASLATTKREIEALGRSAESLAVDMSEPDGCSDAFTRCVADFGPFDILVNNIGGRREAAQIEDQTLESWQSVIDLNLTSCFLGTQIVGKAMIEAGRGGRIINIASMNALIANRGIGGRSYEAAKGAVVQFTRATAADWAPHGITANAVCPGLFMTDANRKWQETRPDVIETVVANIPMGRPGEPREIGPLVVFLAGPGSSYVTGAVITIDGGYTLW